MNDLNRNHASKGYKVVANTSATPCTFFGLTVLEDTVIASLSAPTTTSPERTAYSGDEAALAGSPLTAGLYLPIRGSAITLTSGKVILWKE